MRAKQVIQHNLGPQSLSRWRVVTVNRQSGGVLAIDMNVGQVANLVLAW